MRQLIAGNWKMNGLTAEARRIAGALCAGMSTGAPGCDLLACPPATQLAVVGVILAGSGIALGGQDCHADAAGAHTGDIAAPMLADLGASWVIVGHSERRAEHGETDGAVRAKAEAARAAGLAPIVCVGETEAERAAGRHEAVVGAQVAASLPDGFAGVLAYEPVWAIGTGRSATAEDVAAMHRFLRAALVRRLGESGARTRILYGGSVKPDNAQALLAMPEVGGALVGGASLDPDAFLAIARAAVPITGW